MILIIVNCLCITAALTYEFALHAVSPRFDPASAAEPGGSGVFTLEAWTCDVGNAFPARLGVDHEFHIQCSMISAARWLWILLWLFATGVVVGGAWDAMRVGLVVGRRGGGEKEGEAVVGEDLETVSERPVMLITDRRVKITSDRFA